MTIAVGDTLPDATVLRMGENGPEEVKIADLTKDRKVVIFGLPGAFTGTCTSAHVPSFIRVMDDLKAKGVEDVYCLTVNDPFVTDAWDAQTGAKDAGIVTLADGMAEFTLAVGMDFSAAPVGFVNRSKRYSMLVENGVVKILNPEAGPGECEISAGETLRDQM